MHSITFILYIYPSPFAEAFLRFLIAGMLSGKHLPVVPSRELNSGLPYSKPTRYQKSTYLRICDLGNLFAATVNIERCVIPYIIILHFDSILSRIKLTF